MSIKQLNGAWLLGLCRGLAHLVVLGLVADQLEAQTGTEVLFARVRDAMTAQEIGWQLTDQHTDIQAGYFLQIWSNRAERIQFLCHELASPSEAAEWLSSIPLSVSVGGAKVLPNVGDEALIYAGLTTDGSAVIYFRKAAVTVHVRAPSEQMATRVARLVADQIY